MKINVEFNSVEEMKEFANLIGEPCKCDDKTVTVTPVEEKEVEKDNSKSNKKNTSKKSEKAKEELKEAPKNNGGDKKTAQEETQKVEAEQVEKPEPATEEPPKDVEVTEEPKITKEQLREICAKVMKAGKQSEVKEIFKKYGASKLTELKEEDRTSVYKEVEALQ